jgi:hypothetical protein
VKKHTLPDGRTVHFQHRDVMRANRPVRARATMPASVPATALPVDCTGDGAVSAPMLGNDQYGDCGPVMCAHINGIRTFGRGETGWTEDTCDQAALVAQYLKVSGGDNGTDETMLVGSSPVGIWMSGIAGDPAAIVVDHLDVDVTDIPLRNYCIDQFFAVCMAWSVPDDVLSSFATGASFLNADTPDPNNGHYTPISDVDVNGVVRVFTWGGWFWAGEAFLATVDPECFVTFSPLQFNSSGYDAHGRHVSAVAEAWVALGGNAALVGPVVAQFPAASSFGSDP